MARRSLLSVAVVVPNLDKAVRRYDAEFMRKSIVNPGAYIEKGQGGSIGGKEPYGTEMPAYGPKEQPPQKWGGAAGGGPGRVRDAGGEERVASRVADAPSSSRSRRSCRAKELEGVLASVVSRTGG